MRDCIEDRARDSAMVFVENSHRIFAARNGSAAVNFRQRKTGSSDDGDWRDQQHEQADAVAPDEQEFLADRQPHRAQHHRLKQPAGWSWYASCSWRIAKRAAGEFQERVLEIGAMHVEFDDLAASL